MAKRSRDFVVGLFVLVFGAIFVWGILWISAGGPLQSYDRYVTYLTESVSGLYVDAPLNYQGVDVGKVERIRIDPNDPQRVELLLQVNAGTPITESTIAVLEFQGLTGIANVNLIAGAPGSQPPATAPGADYPEIRSRPSLFARLEANAAALLENLTTTTAQLNGLLGDARDSELNGALRNLAQIAEAVAAQSGRLDQLVTRLDATLANLEVASNDLPELVIAFTESARAVSQTAASVGALSDNLNGASSGVAEAVASSGDSLAQFTRTALPEATAMLAELRAASENLRSVSETLAANPSALLFGGPDAKLGPGE